MKATMGERGQVTIPKVVRDRLGLRPGQRVEVTEEAGRVILEKVVDDDPIQRAYGMLTLPKPVDELIDEMRGPAVLPPET
jgi:AbrB family looped-hinge helix DNA binding protein